MAYLQKRGTGYRVQIRLSGLKTISKTFPTKKLANEFVRKVEGDAKLQQALGGISDTLTTLIDQFLKQYNKKDKSILFRLKFWKEE